jgi:hypothetical protein
MTPMVPLVGVPETIRRGLAPYREVFCRAEGFEHISRGRIPIFPVKLLAEQGVK